MISVLKKYRFLIARRIIQSLFIFLFIGGNYFGWTILTGNLSSAMFLNVIPLSDPYAVLQILFSGFISATDLIVGALIILSIYALLGGRTFCAWVCPMNWFTDLARWLGNKFNLNNMSKIKISRNLRYWILGISLILSSVLGFAAFEMISPIGILHRAIIFGFGSSAFILLAIFLIEMTVIKNLWCGHLCPLGAFYSITGKAGLIRVLHNVEKCTDCMDCFKVCPEVQVLSIVTKSSGVIKSGECTNCARCVEVCNDDALFLTSRFSKKY